jgi:hypothetical protein
MKELTINLDQTDTEKNKKTKPLKKKGMSYLLIGSSNIYRFHKFVAKNNQKYYSLTCCTNLEVWNNIIDDIKAEKGQVIVSIMENLICDDNY